RGQVPLRALRAEAMVTLTRASKLRTNLEAACQAAGFAPRIAAETSDLSVLTELAAEQVGVAVLPASGLEGVAGLVQLGLTHPKLDPRILLLCPPDPTPPPHRPFLRPPARGARLPRPGPGAPGRHVLAPFVNLRRGHAERQRSEEMVQGDPSGGLDAGQRRARDVNPRSAASDQPVRSCSPAKPSSSR